MPVAWSAILQMAILSSYCRTWQFAQRTIYDSHKPIDMLQLRLVLAAWSFTLPTPRTCLIVRSIYARPIRTSFSAASRVWEWEHLCGSFSTLTEMHWFAAYKQSSLGPFPPQFSTSTPPLARHLFLGTLNCSLESNSGSELIPMTQNCQLLLAHSVLGL